MIALDCETLGLDVWHGCHPYCVTTCAEDGTVRWWEWDVDPLTRRVLVPPADVAAIRRLVAGADGVVGQNFKFDAAALGAAGHVDWTPFWTKTEDTLVAAHLLASNAPHDLTALAIDWLGSNIKPHEESLKEAVMACRRRVQQARLARNRGKPKPPREDALADWMIAGEGVVGMPSAGKEPWKADGWLPRAVAAHDGLPDDHPYRTVLADYANTDSETTVRLWRVQYIEMVRRGLLPLYRERMRAVPVLLAMERRGVTVNRTELRRLRTQLRGDADRLERELTGIALARGYPLELPKAGRNASLDGFLFGTVRIECPVCKRVAETTGANAEQCRRFEAEGRECRECRAEGRDPPGRPRVTTTGLCLPPVHNPKAKTDRPCFDAKIAIPWYLDNLPDGPALRFIRAYEKRQGRLKACEYLETYEEFGRPVTGADGWLTLHPHFHATGTSLLRRSCSNPNLQQVGKKKETNLRRCFGPAPGREWWSFDYKNLELRIPAYESGEAALIALFEDPGPPFYGSEHLLNFSVVYPDVWGGELGTVCADPGCCNGATVDLARVGPHVKKKYEDTYYQWVKNGDFAVGYGAVNKRDGTGTADRTFRRPGSQARLEERFAKKAAHNARQVAYAREYGWVETVPDRGLDWGGADPRGYPLLVSRSEWGDVLPTTPLNFRTQGTGGWCTLKAMNRVAPRLDEWTAADPRGYYLIIEVHDELVFDFPAGVGPEPWRTNHARAMEVRRLMELSGDDIGIPLPTDCEYHAVSWAEGLTVTADMIRRPPAIQEANNATDGSPRRTGPRLVRRTAGSAAVRA